MPSRGSPADARKKLQESGLFSSAEIDTLVTLPTLDALLFFIAPFLGAGGQDSTRA